MGSLHPRLDGWITDLAKACGRRRGWATKAVERQIRNRLGAALARRAARMSLATWGTEDNEGDVVLPIADYEYLDRTAAEAPIEPPGLAAPPWRRDSLCEALGKVRIGKKSSG